MKQRFLHSHKKVIIPLVVLSFVFAHLFFIPNKAEAFEIVKDPFNFIKNSFSASKNAITATQSTVNAQNSTALVVKEYTLDGIAKMVAQQLVRKITTSVVQWINTGFEGNPLFITDLQGFLTQTADQIAGDFLAGSGLNFLCSPFKLDIQLGLQRQYTSSFAQKSQCTLTGALANAQNFKIFVSPGGNGFNVGGGWDGWYSMTQNPENNRYDSYMMARGELSNKINSNVGTELNKLGWGSGFLSMTDPATGKITTPGSVIAAQLNNVLGQDLAGIVSADEINEIVGALMGQVMQKAMTGAGGLLGLSSAGSGTNPSGGTSFLDDLNNENDASSISNLKNTTLLSINRTIREVNGTEHKKIKNASLTLLQNTENKLRDLIACNETNLGTSHTPVLTETERQEAQAEIDYASTTIATQITPIKDKILADIANIETEVAELTAIKMDLIAALDTDSLLAAADRYQKFLYEHGVDTIADAESEKDTIKELSDPLNADTTTRLRQCNRR